MRETVNISYSLETNCSRETCIMSFQPPSCKSIFRNCHWPILKNWWRDAMNLGQGMNGSERCEWWKVAMPLIQCPCLPSLNKSVHPVPLPTASTHFACPTQGRSAPEKMPLGASRKPWLTGYCVDNYTTVSLPLTWDNSELHVLDCFPVPWVGVNTFTDLFSSYVTFPSPTSTSWNYLPYQPLTLKFSSRFLFGGNPKGDSWADLPQSWWSISIRAPYLHGALGRALEMYSHILFWWNSSRKHNFVSIFLMNAPNLCKLQAS